MSYPFFGKKNFNECEDSKKSIGQMKTKSLKVNPFLKNYREKTIV